MKTPKMAVALEFIEDELITGAVEYRPAPVKFRWSRYVAAAACVVAVCAVAFQLKISFTGNEAIDIYRVGNSLFISNIADISNKYCGKLLPENLDLESADKTSIELYYDDNGTADNTEDWYSLLIAADYPDYRMTMNCMFGDANPEDWKVDMVFTPEATQTIEINGTKVEVAQNAIVHVYQCSYCAFFTYQGVAYDVRVMSDEDDSSYIYTLLNDILSESAN